jgi:hypothetical protein
MNFNFYDAYGQEISVTDTNQFIELVARGVIHNNTLLFETASNLRQPAWQWQEYQQAIAVLNQRQRENGITPASYAATSPAFQAASQGMGYPVVPTTQKNEISLFSTIEPEEESKTGKILTIVLSVLLFGAALVLLILTGAVFASSPEEAGRLVGEPVGQAFAMAVLFSLFWRIILKKSKRVAYLVISMIFCATAIFNFLGAFTEARASHIYLQEYRSFYDKFNSGVPLPARSFSELSYGKNASLLQASYDFFASFQNDQMEKAKELKELHTETLYANDSLRDVKTIDDARRRLATTIEVINKYEALQGQRFEAMVLRVGSLKIESRGKEEFLTSFTRSFGESFQTAQQLHEVQRTLLRKMDVMLYFMRGKQGSYRFVNDQIKFSSLRDSALYNQHYSEFEALAQRELEINEEIARQKQQKYQASRKTLY